jgi:hypothetical protein
MVLAALFEQGVDILQCNMHGQAWCSNQPHRELVVAKAMILGIQETMWK